MATHDPSYLDIVLSQGLDVRARRVVLHGDLEMDEESGKNPVQLAARALLYLDRHSSSQPIELYISTPGGLISEMFGLYDIIRTRTSPVHTVGYGEVCSAGALLLAAGDHRAATPNCWYMTHDPQVQEEGDLSLLTQRVEIHTRQRARWSKLMARHSGRRYTRRYWEELHQGKTREQWLDAEQMLARGLVDEVMEESG